MAQLTEIVAFLDTELENGLYSDRSLNGLQLDSGVSEVKRVSFAVDAGMTVAEAACRDGSQLLVVHHGLLWGECLRLTGSFGRKAKLLFEKGCSLYASHLPLDGSSRYGNAFELGRKLDVSQLEKFCEYGGSTIGARGVLPAGATLEGIVDMCRTFEGGGEPLLLPFGPKDISSVAIVTGSGSMAIEPCRRAGISLLITGEPKQNAFHEAQEAGLNVIFAGHYATETFGVRSLQRELERRFKVETNFVDMPTGI